MRKILLTFVLLLAPTLLAETADLRFVYTTLSADLTNTGQRFALNTRWHNDGPDPANFINVIVTGTPTPFYVLSVATSGYPCYPALDGSSFSCQNPSLPAGAEAELVLQMITPTTPGNFSVKVELRSAGTDPTPANNIATVNATLAESPYADLVLSPTSQLHRTDGNAETSVPFVVTNTGGATIHNLIAVFMLPVSSDVPPLSAAGEGWSCAHPAYGPQAIVCTRPTLNSGQSAPITVTMVTPERGELTVHARVGGEGFSDPSPNNSLATATVSSVEPAAEPLERILIPLTGGDAPGQGGSLWRVETTALIDSNTQLDLGPVACGDMPICLPVTYPLHRPFRLPANGFNGGDSPYGEFIFVRAADEGKVHINSRVYDVSRQTETAGAEIPIVHERQFNAGLISIVGIPVAPQYRHTLRIYDLEGRDASEVTVRLFANEETTPRTSVRRELTAPESEHGVYPAYLQLDPGQLINLAGITSLRVDVEALFPGSRVWSFVSVTNNDTHHVTTFSAN
jgi:hypothetical protein